MKIFLILALLALSACSGNAQRTAQNLASSAPGQVKDAALSVAIKGKLATIDIDSSAAVNVAVNDGLATLSGQVRSQKVCQQFETAARSMGGVRSVDDRTTINPKVRSVRESVSDVTLIARVDGTLLAQTGVNALKVKTSAHSGVVTLQGTVSSRDVKQTMLHSGRTLGDVKSVVDHIEVRP